MKVNVKSVRFRADQKLEDFIEKKLQKFFGFHEQILDADVVLKLANNETRENKIAEIRLALKGEELFAKKQSKAFEESVDQAIDALKKQIDKYKEKFKK
jgi:putative sigma-54 modulation protein